MRSPSERGGALGPFGGASVGTCGCVRVARAVAEAAGVAGAVAAVLGKHQGDGVVEFLGVLDALYIDVADLLAPEFEGDGVFDAGAVELVLKIVVEVTFEVVAEEVVVHMLWEAQQDRVHL